MKIISFNEAEAVLDPFWDPEQSELTHWTVDSGKAHGLKVRQNWCNVVFEWARRPENGPALRMSRRFQVACGDYDRMVLSVMAPQNAVVGLLAETDRGPRRLLAPPAGSLKRELTLELKGATILECVTLEVEAGSDGIAGGWFNWLGLQNSVRLAQKLQTQTPWDARWEKHLLDESFEPVFAPAYGLVLNSDELTALRDRHAALTVDGRPSPFVAAAEAARDIAPENLIHDFVNFWSDTRYNRERDHEKFILNHGLNLAIAGHLLHDKHLLRLAARYAISIGMCRNWDDGFICRFPGSNFEHRCFVQSLCAYEVAGILDLAGECFTETGRDFLLRRLAEEAISAIQFTTWKHDYIFTCNQLAWFSPGRILALGVLQRHWPRVRTYLDTAYHELCDSLEQTVLPDGGYVEGPTYFRCIGRDSGLGIYYYSRAVAQPMAQLIPGPMKRCGTFAEALISTDTEADVVSICDSLNQHEVISQAIMAGLLPKSAWSRMLHKTISRNSGWPINAWPETHNASSMADAAIAWGLMSQEPVPTSEPPALLTLQEMGPVVSHRRLGAGWVKLFLQGNRAGAGHTHEDKGSFVLEFAGETFALDPGICGYSHPLANELKNCERHNMLVPYGMHERPHPECPLQHDVKPVGTGDATAFHAELDATPGWGPYYRRWRRTWDSPSPDRLVITDDYELVAGEGVMFFWQTCLPATINGSCAVITGKQGQIELQAPEVCTWSLDELPLPEGVQRRLAFRVPGNAGVFSVQVQLQTKDQGFFNQ